MMSQALLGALGPPLAAIVAAAVSSAAIQTISGNSTLTPLAFTTLDSNSDPGIWDGATRFTAPTAGFYFISGTVLWDNNGSATARSERIRINGAAIYNLRTQSLTTVNTNYFPSGAVYYLAAGDYVELVVSWDFVTGATCTISDAKFGICKLAEGTIASRVAAQSIPASTRTPITFTAAVAGQDTGGFWSAGAPNVLTDGAAGMYLAFCSVAWDYLNTSGRRAYIRGVGSPTRGFHAADMISNINVNHNVAVLYMSGTDNIDLYVEQGTAGALNALNVYCGLAKSAAPSIVGGSCRRTSGAQSIPTGSGTWTPIVFDLCDGNQGNVWSVGAPSRATIPAGESGWYAISGFVQWAIVTGGQRYASLRKNGTTHLTYDSGSASTSASFCGQQVSCCVYLAAGDYVELVASHTQGAALNTSTFSSDMPVMGIAKLK